MSDVLKPLLNSHLWHVLEELTYSAYLLNFMIVMWFFGSREQNLVLSMSYLFQITISSCILSYLGAIPFYLLIERPFRNFLDLIFFPRSSIFKKTKDIDDDESEEDTEDEQDVNEVKIDGLINKSDISKSFDDISDAKKNGLKNKQMVFKSPSSKHKSSCRFC